MLRNYLIIAYRNLIRNKTFSVINILGLAVGMAVSILIFLWVKDELSYDRFYPMRDRIFKVLTRDSINPDIVWVTSPFPLAPALFQSYPDIIDYTRYWPGSVLVRYKEKSYLEDQLVLVDPGFFRMFSIDFLSGDPETALNDINNVVITENTAEKVFGNEEPVGKIVYHEDRAYHVTGVIKDPPKNSLLQYNALGHINNVPELRLESWAFAGPSYVLIREGYSKKEVEAKIVDFYRTLDPVTTAYPCLQNISKVYLSEYGKAGRILHIYLFSFIAILILLIACINYMNLMTAKSTRRAREIGIRKIVGAGRLQIIRQFYNEAMSLTLIALFLAFIAVELIRPVFNHYTGKNIEIDYADPVFLVGILIIALFTGLASGYYPALMNASFNPVTIIRGELVKGLSGRKLRSGLVVFQFFISISLIICAMYVSSQINYIRNKELGYEHDQIVSIPYNPVLQKQFDVFKEELMRNPNIVNVSATTLLPNDVTWQVSLNWEGNPNDEGIPVRYLMVDYGFIETMGMQMIEGRSFSPDFPTDDSIGYIINETAMKQIGTNNPVGMRIKFQHPEFPERFRKGYIIGVVNNFHFRPLREESGALVMRMYRPWYNYFVVRLGTENISPSIDYIKKIYNNFSPEYPFKHAFFDETFDELYKSEIKIGKVFKYFSVLAVFISILGLYGLTAFSTERRTKEIAIRKVNGGSFNVILRMLLFDFSKRIMLAFFLASVVSWYILQKVMENYAYHVSLSWRPFVIAGLIALLVAGITILYHTVITVSMNPVNSLRYE